jgi:hypothetical protein
MSCGPCESCEAAGIVDLLERDDLYAGSDAVSVARAELRADVTRLARSMFASAFTPDVADFVATPRRDRDELLRRLGHTPAARRPPRLPPEPRPDEITNLDSVVAALRTRFANPSHQPTAAEVRTVMLTMDQLAPRTDTADAARVSSLIAECRQILQALRDDGRVPADVRRMVCERLGIVRLPAIMRSSGMIERIVRTSGAGLLLARLPQPASRSDRGGGHRFETVLDHVAVQLDAIAVGIHHVEAAGDVVLDRVDGEPGVLRLPVRRLELVEAADLPGHVVHARLVLRGRVAHFQDDVAELPALDHVVLRFAAAASAFLKCSSPNPYRCAPPTRIWPAISRGTFFNKLSATCGKFESKCG